MDHFLFDPDIKRLPPEEVRLLDLRATPLVDRRRVHVLLELTPFLKRPEIEINLTDPDGKPCGTASLIEPMSWKLELTLHIRPAEIRTEGSPEGKYKLEAVVSYPEEGQVDHRAVNFVLPPVTQ